MHLPSYSRIAVRQWRSYGRRGLSFPSPRYFSVSSRALVIKPFLLADIGEGM
jgi:2-oxoisovalerate dehydrogenase E2 component (dihydrolipoyl transacylase)